MIAISIAAAALPAAAFATGSSARAATGSSARAAVLRAPRAELIDPICQTALDPPARVVSVTAVMRPLSGTQKLAIEFQLYERAGGASAWTLVSVPGAASHLNVWLSPSIATLGRRPGDVWEVPFPVAQLSAPAAYRFRVSFRWTGSRGRVLGLVTRVSAACRQTELRPDLTVSSVAVAQQPLHPRVDAFTAVIDNAGVDAAALPFGVELSYTHNHVLVTRQQTLARLAGHGSRTITFTGPLCDAGTPVTVTADPLGQIDVYTRSQASLTVACPTQAVPSTTSASARRG